MASADALSPRVVPARVSFLTIYNPTLGDTEETEREQIVFWVGREELDGKRKSRSTGRQDSRAGRRGDVSENDAEARHQAEEEESNQRLRQIGLARGMVEFAKNFTNDSPLDAIETDRSRIVLHELEPNWWILASIDLTRLPLSQKQDESTTTGSDASTRVSAQQRRLPSEYSSREVSPANLLREQLVKAHNLFLLHHAASLWDMYHKLGRDRFCAILERYWENFAKLRWDVLLHGNPAVDVYGDCTKLAGGGELGVGVGEEEWGSGEREVLEVFVERTEGCVEFLVGRYGNAPPENSKKNGAKGKQNKRRGEKDPPNATKENAEGTPWLGAGEDPDPADGIIFSGVGTVSRRSLATVSQWMESIFRYGDAAYGVSENPSARPRQRRRRPRLSKRASEESSGTTKDEEQKVASEVPPRRKSPRSKKPDLRRQAMENSATPPGLPPGIPAPLVGTVERSPHEALTAVAEQSNSKDFKSSPRQGKSEDEAMAAETLPKEESSIFSVEGMKNALSFGYGSSWTLNPKGFEKKEEDDGGAKSISTSKSASKSDPQVNPTHRSQSTSGSQTADLNRPEDSPPRRRSLSGSRSVDDGQASTTNTNVFNNTPALQQSVLGSKPAGERLQEIDPTPEVSDEDPLFQQRLEQSIGKFLIGLSGDLENMEFEDTDEPVSPVGSNNGSRQPRLFHRTLTVELANAHYQRPGFSANDRKLSQTSKLSKLSAESATSNKAHAGPEPKTSAAASVDGASPIKRYEKMQVAVYVHQPFIFVFLFELHTPSLTMPSFYRSIHHQLGPLQKPLLQRTDPGHVAERIAAALNEKSNTALDAVKRHVDSGNAIYDLVYDPTRSTVRTSVPNIPVPASPEVAVKTSSVVSGSWYTLGIPIGTASAASALRSDSVATKPSIEPWSRVEALNVHMQILNTFAAARNPHELEHTVKTARGWWVLWMKVLTPGKQDSKANEAFLVRKSADYAAKPIKESRSANAGRWLLRDQTREVSGGNPGAGGLSAGAKGVSEGVGVDAKKWVEGLLSLTQ